LAGATKGNTLEAARVKLSGGDSRATVKAYDLERSRGEIAPVRPAPLLTTVLPFSAMAVRPRPLANSAVNKPAANKRRSVRIALRQADPNRDNLVPPARTVSGLLIFRGSGGAEDDEKLK
jgi:hypothetical protein